MDSRADLALADLNTLRARSALKEGRGPRPLDAREPADGVGWPALAERYGAAAENALALGDNLPLLRALAASGRRFQCIYVDPPFNTGRTFASYVDRRTPSDWASMMRPRLEVLRELVDETGALVAEIDDTELAQMLTLLDDVFGRDARLSTITVVRSAATGHKAQNRGPVNVTDFLLVYAKDRRRLRCAPLTRPRRGFDPAYRLFVEGRDEPPSCWRFVPLAAAAARSLGFASRKEAERALGREGFAARKHAFALANGRCVARLAQPRLEAISQKAQALTRSSREEPDRIFVLERSGRPPFILKGGNRVLFLEAKLKVGEDGAPCLVEPLTNVWDDVPFQGIAGEGGVRFVRNKKPERLLERILAMFTEPADWVLDPFLGSGTTCAVAHKMGRRYVGIEESESAFALAVSRLRAVVDGRDLSGVTRSTGFSMGGGFAVFR